MSTSASRAKPILTAVPICFSRAKLGFRYIFTGMVSLARSSAASLSQLSPDSGTGVAGTKILESFKEEFEIGSKLITLETGKIARFANGAVVIAMDETKVLSTVVSAKADGVRDFLPLTVDYQEKHFAQGMIPNTYMRREGAPKERELLCGRIIDRPIRPLFPKGFYHDIQIISSVLSSDGKQDPDVMAANATSSALMLSDIPWNGPIGMIRIGRICGKLVVNPSMDELSSSDLNLIYACTRDKTLMIDVQSLEITEKDLRAAMRLAHCEAVKYLEPQIRLAAKVGKPKKEYKLSMMSDSTLNKVRKLAEKSIENVFTDPTYGKFERGEALDNISKDVKIALEEDCDEESLAVYSNAVDTVRKEVVRRRILAHGLRVDGRHLDDVRPLYCEAGSLPVLHGSSIFSRGDTQVLCTVTLGSPGEAQRLDSVVGPTSKKFLLHYSFPPYSINEVGKKGGLNRREVGHGTLAEKAVLAVLPEEESLLYTIRVNSEVMASDGSTSMASVCGASLALMDAGIPLRSHVAGVSVGLVTDVDPSTGSIKDYRILTDILGLEDHLGDMDFKIAGTRKGITAIQLDIKPAGIPLDIVCESLDAAYRARIQILDRMEQEINVPRSQDERNSPLLATFRYGNDSLRRLIGPMGVLKRKIEEETGVRISVSDGLLTLVAKSPSVMEKAQERVNFLIGCEIVVGEVYTGMVTTVKEYGAFVEFNGGQHGLLHKSELSHDPVDKVSDVVSVGQQISLMCIGQDVRGNIKLSLKATSPKPESAETDFKSPTEPEIPTVSSSVDDDNECSKVEELLETGGGVFEDSTPFVIRSAAECDAQEKTENFSWREETEKSSRCSKSSTASNITDSKYDINGLKFNKRDDKEMDNHGILGKIKDEQVASKSHTIPKEPAVDTDRKTSKWKLGMKVQQTIQELSSSNQTLRKAGEKVASKPQTSTVSSVDDTKTKHIKIGMEVTATVYQIRAYGLVLDFCDGIHGMYRFKMDGKKDFKVGDKMRVVCSNFSSKGIPIMTLAPPR